MAPRRRHLDTAVHTSWWSPGALWPPGARWSTGRR